VWNSSTSPCSDRFERTKPSLCDLSKAGAEQSRGVNWEDVFASLNGRAQQLYEDVYCQHGRMENPIKLHNTPRLMTVEALHFTDDIIETVGLDLNQEDVGAGGRLSASWRSWRYATGPGSQVPCHASIQSGNEIARRSVDLGEREEAPMAQPGPPSRCVCCPSGLHRP